MTCIPHWSTLLIYTIFSKFCLTRTYYSLNMLYFIFYFRFTILWFTELFETGQSRTFSFCSPQLYYAVHLRRPTVWQTLSWGKSIKCLRFSKETETCFPHSTNPLQNSLQQEPTCTFHDIYWQARYNTGKTLGKLTFFGMISI